MVKHINSAGGWTIVGWFMMGSVVDAATTSTDRILNNDITIHLSYVYPTKPELLFQTEEYKQLQISST